MACPVTYVISGIFTVSELRKEMGDPTLHEALSGWVSNDMLCDIIQRHHDEAVVTADQRIEEFVARTGRVGPDQLYDEIDVTLAPDDFAALAQGTLDLTTYWPNIKAARMDTPEEHLLAQDEQILKTSNTSFFARYRYMIDAGRLLVLPSNATNANVSIANLQKTRNFHIGGTDGVMAINQKILADAKAMLEARIKEGTRLDPTSELDDGLIDDSAN